MAKRTDLHETLARESPPAAASDRAFGVVMAAACCVIAGLGYWFGAWHWPFWVAAASILALAAWLSPARLAPLNRLWSRFGALLHRVTSPIVMGLLFFAIVTPIGWLLRLRARRLLELRSDPSAASYWIKRGASDRPQNPSPTQY